MRRLVLLCAVAVAGCTDGRFDPLGVEENIKARQLWCDAELRLARSYADSIAVRAKQPEKHSVNCGYLWAIRESRGTRD
jgi:hypothetical protein